MTDPLLDEVLRRVGDFEIEAREVLGSHEATTERVFSLEQSYGKLDELSVAQDELFREALRAVEVRLYRAAHVLAWAGFVDFLHNYLWDNFEPGLSNERASWNLKSAEDFREHGDFQVIETGRTVGAYNRTLMKALHGLLNTRNECAHPTGFFPELNEALGYFSGLLQRITYLQGKVAT